jgi:hypothetical protein
MNISPLLSFPRNCSSSLAADEWGVWCGGFAATPHPPIPLHAEQLHFLLIFWDG